MKNPTSFEIIPVSGGWRVHYTNTETGKIVLWSYAFPEIDEAWNAIATTRIYASTAPAELARRFYLAS